MKQETKVFTDQMGFEVRLPWPPVRIISLVPSQTELLAYLGLEEEVVGITKFCIHPAEWFRNKKRIGGTKKVDFTKIEELRPDLIIANKEENTEKQIKQLMQRYPVWISDIHNLKDALDMIRNVGKLVNKYEKADELANNISNNFKKRLTHSKTTKKVAYFIWRDPYMAVGKGSFINSMIEACNFENAFRSINGDYPIVDLQQIKDAKPDLILLSSEPFPFSEKHIEEFKLICPEAKVMLVDGEYFSWYGSRLLNAPLYLNKVMEEATNE